MNNVIRPNFKRSAPFVVNVIFDAECGMWVASCDALHTVTEASSYEALTARFWEIAPEVALANGVAFDSSSRVQFRHLEDAASRIAM